MATIRNPGANPAPRPAARHAALKDEAPGVQAEGSKVFQRSTHRKARSHDCEPPQLAGQQVTVGIDSSQTPVLASVATMSTKAIAELTGKEHRNVLADVRAMLDALGKDVLSFQQMLPDAYGRMQPVFALPKDLTLTLVAGYSIPMRHRIVVRWQELEEAARGQQPALPNFANPVAAARAWANEFELRERLAVENQHQAQALAIAAHKIGALNRIATATEDAACLREAAKLAQVPERQYTEFMREEGWIFKHRVGGRWMGRADKESAGLLELKRLTFTRPDGTEGANVQVLVTPRGQAKIAELIERKAPHLRKTKPAQPTATGDGLVPEAP